MVDSGSPSKFMQVCSKGVLLHISFKLESDSQKLYRSKKKMERQLHHTSDGLAIITNTPPQPQDGKTMAMAQIHPCWYDLASVMVVMIAWLVEAFLLILMGWIDFGRTPLVEAFVLIFWCLRFELHFWDTWMFWKAFLLIFDDKACTSLLGYVDVLEGLFVDKW